MKNPICKTSCNIAEVVFNIPLERSFHYLVPREMQDKLIRGMRVRAPFGPREKIGLVIRLLDKSPVRNLKVIRQIIDPLAVISGDQWKLAEWVSAYYCCSLGEALAVMVPANLRIRSISDVANSGAGCPMSDIRRGRRLSAHQKKAMERIQSAIERSGTSTLLLRGVTGSGKTELYLKAISIALRHDKGAICMVPEISLTPQTIERFRERFGKCVAIWHSRLDARERRISWINVATGKCRILVGARSAVFAPMERIGLIILDEEHESTYKQQDTPRYHAREVAKRRAQIVGATVLLGSATPSVESYFEALRGKEAPIILPERIKGRAMPHVDVIDLREEFRHRRRSIALSMHLERAIRQTIDRGEQTMLLINRRGFARVALCTVCGHVMRCDRCSVPLVYHAGQKELRCHYCNRRESPPEICTGCHKGYLRMRGIGTERVESELHRLFPETSIARMDTDATRKRGSHGEFYEALKSRRTSLLVGTQMIAKGLDFPQVTLVGVVSADTALNLPDFRAGERTFDLLSQVAGRAGRGNQTGRVIIQTYCPTHYAIRRAAEHDYDGFYADEIRMRKRLSLPPWTHHVELTFRGSNALRVQERAEAFSKLLHRHIARRRITILGPSPHRVARMRRSYRVCIVLRAKSVEPVVEVLREALQSGRRFGGIPITVDVDPL